VTLARWEVPENWTWVEAKDVAQIVGGGTPPSKDNANFAEDGIPWIGPADLTGYQGTYISRGRRSLSEQGYVRSGATLMPAGSVLFSSRAPIGYCAIATGPISTNQGFKSWVCEQGVIPEYARYYLLSSVEYVDSLASGTTFREVSGKRVEAIAFPLPPEAEQRRIVAKLDALTARLARARAELARVPVLAKRLREQAIESFLSPGDGARGWEIRPLSRLAIDGPTNGWSPKSDQSAQGALTLKLTATTSGRLRLDEAAIKRIHEVPPPNSKFWLKSGDLLVQRANALEHVGATAIFDGPSETYIYPDLMMRLRFADSRQTRLVWYKLNSPSVRRYFRENATGTAGNMPKISGKTLGNFPMPLPPKAEWDRVITQLDATFARADRLEAEAARARALLDRLESALLAKAFRGELVPQDASDEPAGVLLDRIRTQRAAAPKAKRGRKAKVAA
jgi:type I restriction enzyme, S subunit